MVFLGGVELMNVSKLMMFSISGSTKFVFTDNVAIDIRNSSFKGITT